MFKFIRNRIIENKTYSELNKLSNRELADIGITRSDIRNIARQNVSEVF
jgi:uncharacterized protein YjiS (DUF1127 family)